LLTKVYPSANNPACGPPAWRNGVAGWTNPIGDFTAVRELYAAEEIGIRGCGRSDAQEMPYNDRESACPYPSCSVSKMHSVPPWKRLSLISQRDERILRERLLWPSYYLLHGLLIPDLSSRKLRPHLRHLFKGANDTQYCQVTPNSRISLRKTGCPHLGHFSRAANIEQLTRMPNVTQANPL
jgi:hypothetical protein